MVGAFRDLLVVPSYLEEVQASFQHLFLGQLIQEVVLVRQSYPKVASVLGLLLCPWEVLFRAVPHFEVHLKQFITIDLMLVELQHS